MKSLSVFTLLSLSFGLMAQNPEIFAYSWELSQFEHFPIKYDPPSNVKEIVFKKNKKGKMTTYSKKFNESGQLIEVSTTDKKKKHMVFAVIEWDENNEVSKTKIFRRGKLKNSYVYVRSESNKPLRQSMYNTKNEIISESVWKYNENDCVSEFLWLKKDEKIGSKWVYEYREDCERSKAFNYNGKGKLKKTWTYDCKEEGEILEKKKDLTQVCKWEEVSPEVITKVYQTFDEKGKIIKNVSKFTATDTLILEWAQYNEENELKYKSTYDKDVKKRLTYTRYKKGKEWYHFEYKYQNDLIKSKSFARNGKVYYSTEYIYNDESQLSEYKAFKKNGDLRSTITLGYTYYSSN